MLPEKVEFDNEQETMLITLYARALHGRTQQPILRDPWAEEIVDRIDHDFAKFKLSPSEAFTFAARAKKFDLWVGEFLTARPGATVLYLGCGLDARVYRLDPPADTRWYDVDYPEVIDLRKRLYPRRLGHTTIGSALADLAWLDDVPGDQPVFVVAEGVTMYLTEDIIRRLLHRIVDHFPSGQIAFDAHSRRLVSWMARTGRTVRSTGASFRWGIDGPADVEQLEPRLAFVKEYRTSELPGYARLSWAARAQVRAGDLVPAFRGLSRPLLFRFPAAR